MPVSAPYSLISKIGALLYVEALVCFHCITLYSLHYLLIYGCKVNNNNIFRLIYLIFYLIHIFLCLSLCNFLMLAMIYYYHYFLSIISTFFYLAARESRLTSVGRKIEKSLPFALLRLRDRERERERER